MFTILPRPWSSMIRPARVQSWNDAVRLTSITSSQSARSWSTASEGRPMPCEFTRTSSPPSRSIASSKPRRRSSRSARSARIGTPPISAATSSVRSERPSTATVAPACASASARPRPMPPLPPVTSARRPVRSKGLLAIPPRHARRARRGSGLSPGTPRRRARPCSRARGCVRAPPRSSRRSRCRGLPGGTP